MKKKLIVIYLSIVAGLIILLFGRVVDFLFFYAGEGDALQVVFRHLSSHELYDSILVMVLLIGFGFFLSNYLLRLGLTAKEVKETVQKIKDNEQRVRSVNQRLRATEQQLRAEILDRVNAEEVLLKEKKTVDAIIDSLPGVFYRFDSTGHFNIWNENLSKVTEYSRDEISEMNPIDFFTGADKQRVADAIQEVMEKGKADVVADIITKSEKKKTHYFTGLRTKEDGVLHVVGMGVDISDIRKKEKELETSNQRLRASEDALKESEQQLLREIIERKQAEKILKESEERFRVLFRDAPLPYQSLDERGNILYVNDAWLNMLGYEREAVVGKNFSDFIYNDYKKIFIEKFPQFKLEGQVCGVRYQMLRKDGSTLLVEFTGKVRFDSEGRFVQTHCIFQDITERVAAEDQIKNLAKFPGENPEPVMRVSKEGNLLYANRAAAPVLKSWGVEVGKSIPEKWKGIVDKALSSGERNSVAETIGPNVFLLAVVPIISYGYVNLYAKEVTGKVN